MMHSLSGSKLGIWVAHGEGKFELPNPENYNITGKYSYSQYPGNPNGSDADAAILSSDNGRHTAMMPHLERSILPWQWSYYKAGRTDDISPWIEAFINARKWVEKMKKQLKNQII